MILGFSRTFTSGPTPPLTNMQVWLKMPISGQSVDAEILTWPDSSGHGKDGAGLTTFAPIYKTNILDGFAAARFTADATHEPMTIPINGATEAWSEGTVYILVKRTQDPGNVSGAGTAMWRFSNQVLSSHFNFSDNNIYEGALNSSRLNTGDPTPNLSTNFRLYAVKSKSSDWTSYLDGVQHFNTGTNSFSVDNTALLGQSGTVGTRYGFDGDVIELIIYKAWHDDTTRGLVEAYFSTRFPSLDF